MKTQPTALAWFPVTLLILIPAVTLAQATPGVAEATGFVDKFNEVILFPTIALLSAVAFLVFLWGCAEYFFNAENDQARTQGVKHIMWGIIGLVIMVSAFSILKIAAGTFRLNDELRCADNPTASGCENVFKIPSSGTTGSGSGNTGGTTGSGSGNTGGTTGTGSGNTGGTTGTGWGNTGG